MGLYLTLLAIGGAVTTIGLGQRVAMWRRGASMLRWVVGVFLVGFGALVLLAAANVYIPERSGMRTISSDMSVPVSSQATTIAP